MKFFIDGIIGYVIIVVCIFIEYDCFRLMSGKNFVFFLKKKNYFIICFLLGINIFLDGFVFIENLRFRELFLVFKVVEIVDKVCIVLFKLFLYYY